MAQMSKRERIWFIICLVFGIAYVIAIYCWRSVFGI
jgi:uncharacterized membrane protein